MGNHSLLSVLVGLIAFTVSASAQDAAADGRSFEKTKVSAEKGDALAQFNLGMMYSQGLGVQKAEKEAIKWWLKAAQQNHAAAQCNLGVAYLNGHGVPKDEKEAIKWYWKAAEQNDALAQYNLGLAYFNGHGVPKDEK